MSTRGPNGPSPGSPNSPMLIWFVALLAVAGVVWFLLVLSGATDAGTSLVVVAWVMLILSFGVSTWTRNRQRRRYRQRFPSIDDLRRHVDTEALRTIRDRDSQTAAVKRLRREVPGVPLAEAVQLIKSL